MTLGNGIKPKVISIDWNEQFADASGKVDREAAYTPKLFAESTCDFYATGLYKLAWRMKKMDMVTINPSRHMIVVKAANKNSLKNANDLAGKTAVTYKDSSYHTWLDEQNRTTYKANPIRIIFVADEPQALAALDEGKADFTVLVADDAVPEVRKTQHQFAIAFPAGSLMEMSWAFQKEDKDLQGAANDFFQAQRANKDSLLNKQFDNLYGMSVSEFSKMVSDNSTEGQVQR